MKEVTLIRHVLDVVSKAAQENLSIEAVISEGVVSRNYIARTDSGRRYILRVDSRPLRQLRGDVGNMRAARRAGVSAPLGPFILRRVGSSSVLARPYAVGHPLGTITEALPPI